MTTRPTVSIAQLDVQEAAEAGKLSRSADPFYDLGAWRIDGGGPAVTVSATDAGRALLADLRNREPNPEAS